MGPQPTVVELDAPLRHRIGDLLLAALVVIGVLSWAAVMVMVIGRPGSTTGQRVLGIALLLAGFLPVRMACRFARRALCPRPYLAVIGDALEIVHPAVLDAPLVLPMESVGSLIVDDGSKHARFPVVQEFSWAEPGAAEGQLGVLWSDDHGSPFPLLATNRSAPNIALVLNAPTTVPAIRRPRIGSLHPSRAVRPGVPEDGLLLRARDVVKAREALAACGAIDRLEVAPELPADPLVAALELAGDGRSAVTLPEPEGAPPAAGAAASRRAFVALALAAGFAALCVLTITGLVLLLVSANTPIVGLACLLLIYTLVRALTPRRSVYGSGRIVTVQEAPRLHRLVEQVAAAIGCDPPDEIRVALGPAAWAARERRGLRSRRVLCLGLPNLAAGDEAATRAVVAHELAHHHHADATIGIVVGASAATMTRVHHALRGRRQLIAILPARALAFVFDAYARFFFRITRGMSRRQEFAADAASVAVAGTEAAVGALRASAASAHFFDAYWQQIVTPDLERGIRPPVGYGFAQFLAERQAEIAPLVDVLLADEQQDPYATHPPTAQRIRALQPGVAGPAGAATGLSLIDGVDAIELDLLSSLAGKERVSSLRPSADVEPVEAL